MDRYLAHRIEGGYLDYLAVVSRYPQYKVSIDSILTTEGYGYLIVSTEDNYIEISKEKITINNEYISIAS